MAMRFTQPSLSSSGILLNMNTWLYTQYNNDRHIVLEYTHLHSWLPQPLFLDASVGFLGGLITALVFDLVLIGLRGRTGVNLTPEE